MNFTYSEAQWYNSKKFKVSYKRMYKSGSSSIVDLLGEHTQTPTPKYKKTFTVIREPYARSRSIYKELVAMKKINCSYSDYLKELQNGFIDKHQLPQTFWLKGIHNIRIFKLEEIEDLIEWIKADKKDFNHLNKRDLEIEESEEDKKIIREVYKLDFYLYYE